MTMLDALDKFAQQVKVLTGGEIRQLTLSYPAFDGLLAGVGDVTLDGTIVLDSADGRLTIKAAL